MLTIIQGGEKKLSFAKKIKELRLKHGLSLRELGEAVNVNYSHLSRLESGQKAPSIDMIELLASYYKVKPSYLLDADTDDELTEEEEELLEDADLPLEEIKKKYNITFEGKSLSDDELIGMLTWLKVKRGMDG